MRPFTAIKYVYSTCLLLFSFVLISSAIITDNTKLAQDSHPAVAMLVFLLAILLLNMVEGGQGAFVGLPPIQKDLYKDSHRTAWMCTTFCHRGDNLGRYLIGRQFMVVLLVFVINLAATPLNNSEVLGLPKPIQTLFLTSGLAKILCTAMIGQLNAQVNASRMMLDFINTYLALFTVYVALIIEASGLLHVVYLLKLCFGKIANKRFSSNEDPPTELQVLGFWLRAFMSTIILVFSVAVTLGALYRGQTTMWEGVSPSISLILFFVLLGVSGILEGMQIASYAVAKLPSTERESHPLAMKTCNLLFSGNGKNLPGFMIGRQVCVTFCFFIMARIATVSIDVDQGEEPIFGVSARTQRFLNTGLLGAVVTTTIGSISWQLVASSFPISFLSNPLVYVLLRWCLIVEATGIFSAAWVLAAIHRRIARFQKDEIYVGTAEQRAANSKNDEQTAMPQMGTFVLHCCSASRDGPEVRGEARDVEQPTSPLQDEAEYFP